MKKIICALMAFIALTVYGKEYTFQTVEGDPLQARIYTLDNGLTVYPAQIVVKLRGFS